MKANDAVSGAVLLLLGLVTLWHVQSFPAMPGQKYGASLFPGLIGAGLVLCGVLLIVRGAKSAQQWVALEEWTARRRPVAGFMSVLAGLGLYVVFAEPLGFHLTGFFLVLLW